MFSIIGAGPVGLSIALLLAKKNIKTKVYEARLEIKNDPQQSYPIGINPRGLYTLHTIDPQLAQHIQQTGEIVDSWQIFGGNQRVAKQDSGVVYGTSRAKVNMALLDKALKEPLIELYFGYKLLDIDFQSKSLIFLVNNEKLNIPASETRIIAADGCNSKVRKCLDQHSLGFKSLVVPWSFEFRVLFAKPGDSHPDLDTKVHYIFNGCYTATVEMDGKRTWTCVMGSRDFDSDEKLDLLLSKEPSSENIAKLKAFIQKVAPKFAVLLSDEEELKRTFRGAVVKCNRLNDGEWILLLGDAAHSVLPPVGEGINSGLEDCLVLYQLIDQANSFQAYQNIRYPDCEALVEYAHYLNDAASFSGTSIFILGERGARLFFQILEGSTHPNIGENLFGPLSSNRTPYSKIMADWKRKKKFMLPLCRLIIYPFALLVELIRLPFQIGKKKKRNLGTELKPPIQLNVETGNSS